MQAGLLAIFQNYQSQKTDTEVYQDVMGILESAEPLGFDFVLVTEHHFADYSMSPDNTNILSYLAAKTDNIKLGTGAIIVPWHDPLRCAEKMLVLDQLSQGRALLGLGRGLARIEYEILDLDMSDSRERFDEGARMIKSALETGFIESDGPMYPQKRAQLRPGPYDPNWDDRFFSVGMSPASVLEAAKMGARLMSFSTSPWEAFKVNSLEPYIETFEATHKKPAPPLVTADLVIVHEDEERARELAAEHFKNYYYTVTDFYELKGDHFSQAKGYESYAAAASATRDLGDDKLADDYVEFNLYGTPDQVTEKIRERRRVLEHPFDIAVIFEGGGLSVQDMSRTSKLFADKIKPVLETFD